jgi:DnaJ-class molecular chaperone
MKKDRPIAFCTGCHEYSHNARVINEPHRRTKYGAKCKGVFSSALNNNDWITCPSCEGTGNKEGKCEHCDGWGWLLNRK